jgi:hypothetical protein
MRVCLPAAWLVKPRWAILKGSAVAVWVLAAIGFGSALWFDHTRRSGGAILHHRHIRSVVIREWSPKMDGIAGSIWASKTTIRPCRRDSFYGVHYLRVARHHIKPHVASNGP